MHRADIPIPPEVLASIADQAEWAARRGLALNRNGTGLAAREASVFGGIDPDTRAQLTEGAGDELGRLHSLRSSTALTLNVFQPWKSQPRPIGEMLGATAVREVAFEQKQPIWPTTNDADPTPPHLDVLLTGTGSAVGIESKFLELYTPAANSFRPSYFPADDLESPLWAGLPACRHLAERIARGEEVYFWLAAGQLLKHALGLSKNQQDDFRLVLVWYRVEGPTADVIEEEIGRFSRVVSAELNFTALTYQELIPRLRALVVPEPADGYYVYLEDRYGLGREVPRPLPLVALGRANETKRRTDLAVRTASLNLDQLTAAYFQTTARAPQRALRPKPYLMPAHDGKGGVDPRSKEKVAAKAIFNYGQPLAIGDESVAVVDYEVPLAARQGDDGVGDIDLLGLGLTSGRPWIIELKVRSNTEPPSSALLQALRYSAMLDANRRQVSAEVKARTGRGELVWPAVIAVAADTEYWRGWHRESKATGDWLPALRRLATGITQALGVEVVFVDLGSVEWTVIDGVAQLVSPLDIQVI